MFFPMFFPRNRGQIPHEKPGPSHGPTSGVTLQVAVEALVEKFDSFDQRKGGFIRENHHLSWVHLGKSSMNGPGKCSIDMFNNQMVLWKSGWFQERCGLPEGRIIINSKKWYVHQEKKSCEFFIVGKLEDYPARGWDFRKEKLWNIFVLTQQSILTYTDYIPNMVGMLLKISIVLRRCGSRLLSSRHSWLTGFQWISQKI